MATFTTLTDGRVKAIIRKSALNGRARTKVCANMKQAKTWANAIETNIDATGVSHYHSLKDVTLKTVLLDYRDDGTATLSESGATYVKDVVNWLTDREPSLCSLNFTDDLEASLRRFRDRCMKPAKEGGHGNQPATVARKLSVISSAIKYAMEHEQLKLPANPVANIAKPSSAGNRRTRIWTWGDVMTFLSEAGFDHTLKPQSQRDYMPWLLLMAMETGWRRGELCNIANQTREQAARRRDPKHKGYIDLAKREVFFPPARLKNKGFVAEVGWIAPITVRVAATIGTMQAYFPAPEDADPNDAPALLFPVKPRTVGLYWQRLKKQVVAKHPHLRGITFHELRHTFTTRLVNGLANGADGKVGEADKMTLLTMTGRRTIASLLHYFHPSALVQAHKMDRVLGMDAPALPFPMLPEPVNS